MTDDGETAALAVRGPGMAIASGGVQQLPTVDEVRRWQAEQFPEQARTAMCHQAPTAEELAAVEAGGDPVDDLHHLLVEGPNSA